MSDSEKGKNEKNLSGEEILSDFKEKLLEEMEDMPPKYQKLVNDNFWELLADGKEADTQVKDTMVDTSHSEYPDPYPPKKADKPSVTREEIIELIRGCIECGDSSDSCKGCIGHAVEWLKSLGIEVEDEQKD